MVNYLPLLFIVTGYTLFIACLLGDKLLRDWRTRKLFEDADREAALDTTILNIDHHSDGSVTHTYRTKQITFTPYYDNPNQVQ